MDIDLDLALALALPGWNVSSPGREHWASRPDSPTKADINTDTERVRSQRRVRE